MVKLLPPVVREVPDPRSRPTQDLRWTAPLHRVWTVDWTSLSASGTPWRRAARALLAKAFRTARLQTTADAVHATRRRRDAATATMDGAL